MYSAWLVWGEGQGARYRRSNGCEIFLCETAAKLPGSAGGTYLSMVAGVLPHLQKACVSSKVVGQRAKGGTVHKYTNSVKAAGSS